MNKENKKMAQERRAKEREAQKKKEAVKRWAIIGGIVVAVLILVGITVREVKAPADEGANTTGEVTASTESGKLNKKKGLVVEEGDTVNIDYTGYKDGVAFEGGSTNGAGADLNIGSGTYIPGFEEGLVGHKVGETVDLNLTFPENYQSAELAGADTVFTVTINGIYDK